LEIQGNTRKYKEIQGNTRKYKEIQGNTRKYKALLSFRFNGAKCWFSAILKKS